MKKNNKNLAQEWFEKAKDDERSIEAILKNGGSFSTACFLSQQMAEKYLKGFLVYHNKRFPKIHDLLDLSRRCEEIDPEFKHLKEDLLILNDYYIATRYPGDWPEKYSKKEAKEAQKKAKEIKQFILKKLSL